MVDCKTIALGTASVLLAASAVGTAQAAEVSITSITGEWQNPDPAGVTVTYQNNNTSTPRAAWGIPTSGSNIFENRSGYDFSAAGTPISTGSFVTPYTSSLINLGTFTHRNNPIASGTSITGIDLLLNAALSINGAATETYSFLFHFLHNETPNGADPCPFGTGAVNANGCADLVGVSFDAVSDSFEIDGVNYTLNLSGFQTADGFTTSFLSAEGGNNSANLMGRIEAYAVASGVPEPATWAMMILGFGMIGGAVRSRRQKTTVSYA